jgi:phage FluMu protein Com
MFSIECIQCKNWFLLHDKIKVYTCPKCKQLNKTKSANEIYTAPLTKTEKKMIKDFLKTKGPSTTISDTKLYDDKVVPINYGISNCSSLISGLT